MHMRPDDHDLDEEIRGHLAISIQERIERGEDPKAARLAALREFGYIPQARESMRRVWYGRWFDVITAMGRDMRVGLRSLLRAKGLAATVVITLALGIGANAAIFSVVRGVLLRPLVNRGEDRLIYIRQSAPGLSSGNTRFSVPEIDDFKSRATTVSAFGDFSTIEFTLLGIGEPRVVQAGVVSGSYFDVMGLRPVLGRLLNAADDGPKAAGAVVLTHRFWTTVARERYRGRRQDDSARFAQCHRRRRARAVRPLSGRHRDHRQHGHQPASPRRDHGHAAHAPHDRAVRPPRARRDRRRGACGVDRAACRDDARAPRVLLGHRERPAERGRRCAIRSPRRRARFCSSCSPPPAVVFVIACSNVANLILARSVRREGELAVRAALGATHGALRRTLLAESLVLCGAGAVLGVLLARPLVSVVARFAARFSVRALEVTVDVSLLWVGAGLAMAAAVLLAYVPRLPSVLAPSGLGLASGSVRITPGTNRRLRVFAMTQIAFSFVLLAGAGTLSPRSSRCRRRRPATTCVRCWPLTCPSSGVDGPPVIDFLQEVTRRIASCRVWRVSRRGASCRGGTPDNLCPGLRSRSRDTHPRTAKRTRTAGYGLSRLASSRCSACRSSPAAISTTTTAAAASRS